MARRILRLITRLNIGGPARQALLLTRELSGSFPTTLCAGTPPEAEGELKDPEVAVHRVPLVRDVRPIDDLRAFARVRRLAQHHQLIHTHMAKAGAIGRGAARTLRPRPLTVHTFHGHVLEGYFSPLAQRVALEIERRLARSTDVLIAISPEVEASLLRLGVGSEDQYRIIPLGFDLERFLMISEPSGRFRSSLKIPESAPLVGIVGRLAPIKDHATFLDAIARIPEVHAAIVGDGPVRSFLEAQAMRLNIEERVHFCGWRLDIDAVMADLDVVVLTSRNEGTPVALVEALAAARPVVATDVGGVRFVVTHGATGILCEVGDAGGFGAAIEKLLADKELGRSMALRGREEVRSRFSHHRLLRDIRGLYEELLG